ncbi:MAG: sigma-70 family RNA polymerase sigma factor [Clostridia bacterium]|nr:sigma-70 family RNA polymerase sigma factor [Clostridia bacterium]
MKDKLVRKLQRHDENAFEEIMNQYARFVTAIIYHVSKGTLTKEDIEETAADVFVTLWNNAEKVQEGKLKSYLGCIARTRALNKLESVKNKAIVNIEDEDFEDDFSIADETEKKDIGAELRQIIEEISEPDKEILIRYYYYYQTVTKISEAMQLNRDTVKSKLRRTRNKIKQMLTERGYTL